MSEHCELCAVPFSGSGHDVTGLAILEEEVERLQNLHYYNLPSILGNSYSTGEKKEGESEPPGARTPDTLIKSQVLYH